MAVFGIEEEGKQHDEIQEYQLTGHGFWIVHNCSCRYAGEQVDQCDVTSSRLEGTVTKSITHTSTSVALRFVPLTPEGGGRDQLSHGQCVACHACNITTPSSQSEDTVSIPIPVSHAQFAFVLSSKGLSCPRKLVKSSIYPAY